jgi:nicotinamide riboside transporter PnuC
MDSGELLMTRKRVAENLLMLLSVIISIYLYLSRKISDSRKVSSLLKDLAEGDLDTSC